MELCDGQARAKLQTHEQGEYGVRGDLEDQPLTHTTPSRFLTACTPYTFQSCRKGNSNEVTVSSVRKEPWSQARQTRPGKPDQVRWLVELINTRTHSLTHCQSTIQPSLEFPTQPTAPSRVLAWHRHIPSFLPPDHSYLLAPSFNSIEPITNAIKSNHNCCVKGPNQR